MAIDRDGTLRKAEKFLRQGRLDQAIAEYLRVIKEQPRDWSTVNAVGDLFVRAGQIESAVEHFTRIADYFYEEGFLPRASAVYKKILKLKPDVEHAALRSADISERQGLLADAKATLAGVAERRVKRGDRRGAAEIHLRLGGLDPTDLAAGVAASRAAAELGDVTGAVSRLLQLAREFSQRSRLPESLQALEEAFRIAPENSEVRAALVTRVHGDRRPGARGGVRHVVARVQGDCGRVLLARSGRGGARRVRAGARAGPGGQRHPHAARPHLHRTGRPRTRPQFRSGRHE